PLVAAAVVATGNTLEAVLAAWLLRRYGGVETTLDRLRHVAVLITGGAVAATAVSATVGVLTLCVAGVQPWSRFSVLWSIWWLGDATSVLLIAAPLLTVPIWWRGSDRWARTREAAAL